MSKNKQKIRKSIIKRFKATKSGKILRRSSSIRHLRSKKSKSRIRDLKSKKLLTGSFAKKIGKLLGIKSKKVKKEKNENQNRTIK